MMIIIIGMGIIILDIITKWKEKVSLMKYYGETTHKETKLEIILPFKARSIPILVLLFFLLYQ